MVAQIVIAAFVLLGAGFACFGLSMSWLLSPTRPTHGKGLTYECGIEPMGSPWIRFRPGYFVYAILYVIFDVETVFLYPWAVAAGSSSARSGWFLLIEMLLFVAILIGGLVYAWKEGSLAWH